MEDKHIGLIGLTAMIGSSLAVALMVNRLSEISNSKDKIRFEKSQTPIYATVLEEQYTKHFMNVPEKHIEGFVSQAYSNQTVKLDATYSLKIKTDEGKIMGISVKDNNGCTKESLDIIINEGSRISFPTGNINKYGKMKREFTHIDSNTTTASKGADQIKIYQ